MSQFNPYKFKIHSYENYDPTEDEMKMPALPKSADYIDERNFQKDQCIDEITPTEANERLKEEKKRLEAAQKTRLEAIEALYRAQEWNARKKRRSSTIEVERAITEEKASFDEKEAKKRLTKAIDTHQELEEVLIAAKREIENLHRLKRVETINEV
tara:strand:- start:218 stop:685 length:468 start_codon:yes stop_codon:yes gene_type:complete